MAADTRLPTPAPTAADHGTVGVPSRTHRVRAWVLLGFAAWNLLVWGNRAMNIVADRTEWSVGFIVVHLVLFAMGLAAAVALGIIGWRMRGEARASEHAT